MDKIKTVLIVDDNPETLKLLGRFFEKNAYRVLTAGSAVEAMAVLSGNVSIVVTDIDMPVVSGFSLRESIRHSYPHIPVIGISGLRDITNLKDHFDDGLHKPFRLNDLLNIVEKIVNGLFCVADDVSRPAR